MKIVIEGKIINDCENENRYYVELPDGWRIIFEDDEYAGCYYAGEDENQEHLTDLFEEKVKEPVSIKKATEDIINGILDNMYDSKNIIDDLLKSKTMTTELKDGSTLVVCNEYPVHPKLYGVGDPLCKYFLGDDIQWFTERHYAHPGQCALLARFYRKYEEHKENREIYELCGSNACIDCLLNDEHGFCTMKLGLGTAACGGYTKNALFERITKILEEDRLVQDKYGDYYDPRKWYAGKQGIVCAGDCYHVRNIKKENRREFNSLAEALTIGRCRPCKHCNGEHKE